MKSPQDYSILIVDDEPDLLEMLAFDLGRVGFQVDTAEGGEEALRKHAIRRFDLVLTDVRMPKGNGLELLKQIKQISPTTHVVCITGYSNASNSNIIDLGASAVFEKPFDIKKLHVIVSSLLGLISNRA